MAKTDDNLKAAFAGESQASRKYLAFARVAEKEGLAQVARLFRAAAEAETVHAHNHLRAMGGLGPTDRNLESAIDGETYEFKTMYPAFVAQAEADGHAQAARTFRYADAVEEVHAGLYARALEAVRSGKDLPGTALWVCQICGNTVEGEPPEKCPICGARREKFQRVD